MHSSTTLSSSGLFPDDAKLEQNSHLTIDITPLSDGESSVANYGSAITEEEKPAAKITTLIETLSSILDAEPARSNNATTGLPIVVNTVLSTFQQVPADTRLAIVTSLETAGFILIEATKLYQENYKGLDASRLNNAINYSAFFASGFSFTFYMGCEIIANAWAGELPSDVQVNTTLSILLAASVLLGMFHCYSQTKEEQSKIRRISDAIANSLELGSAVSVISRIYNFFPTINYHPEALEKTMAWLPIAISGLASVISIFKAPANKKFSRCLASTINVLYDTGTFLETITLKSYLSTSMLGIKATFFGASQYAKSYFNRNLPVESVRMPLTNDSMVSSLSTPRNI